MTASPSFCANCGAARPAGAAFCPSCGQTYAAAAPQAGIQSNVASGMVQLEQLRLKLIPFRILGIAAGLALWWFVLGPLLGENPLLVLVAFAAVTLGGLYLGNIVGLMVVAGRR